MATVLILTALVLVSVGVGILLFMVFVMRDLGNSLNDPETEIKEFEGRGRRAIF